MAGYLKIVSPKLVNEYRNKIINIHPSLIPSFCGKGYYGEKVHQGVIDYGAKVTGATVHFVDEGADPARRTTELTTLTVGRNVCKTGLWKG